MHFSSLIVDSHYVWDSLSPAWTAVCFMVYYFFSSFFFKLLLWTTQRCHLDLPTAECTFLVFELHTLCLINTADHILYNPENLPSSDWGAVRGAAQEDAVTWVVVDLMEESWFQITVCCLSCLCLYIFVPIPGWHFYMLLLCSLLGTCLITTAEVIKLPFVVQGPTTHMSGFQMNSDFKADANFLFFFFFLVLVTFMPSSSFISPGVRQWGCLSLSQFLFLLVTEMTPAPPPSSTVGPMLRATCISLFVSSYSAWPQLFVKIRFVFTEVFCLFYCLGH